MAEDKKTYETPTVIPQEGQLKIPRREPITQELLKEVIDVMREANALKEKKSLTEKISALFSSGYKILITLAVIGALIVAPIIIKFKMPKTTITIKPFEVPESLMKQGYTPALITDMMKEELSVIMRDTRQNSDLARGIQMQINSADEAIKAEVEVEGAKVSLNAILKSIQKIMGMEETNVRGNIVIDNGGFDLFIKVEDSVFNYSGWPKDSLNNIFHYAAEHIYKFSNPYLAGSHYLLTGNSQDCMDVIKYMLRLKKQEKEAYLLWAELLESQKKYAESIVKFDMAIKLYPKYEFAFCDRGLSKEKLNDHYGAIKDYTIAISLDKNDSLAYNLRGNSETVLGRFDSALNDYNYAIHIDSNLESAYVNRGFLKDTTKKYFEAIKDYNKAQSLNDKDSNIYNLRGLVEKKIGEFDSARKDFDKAIELNPGFTWAYFNRGLLEDTTQNYNDAINNYVQVIRLAPEFANAYYNKGLSEFNLKNYHAAIKDFTMAIKLDDKDADAFNNRANCEERLGYADAAGKDRTMAEKLNTLQ